MKTFEVRLLIEVEDEITESILTDIVNESLENNSKFNCATIDYSLSINQ